MELPKKKTSEADAYNQAGDEAARRGRRDSAEMFYDFAATEQADAERAERGGRRSSRRG